LICTRRRSSRCVSVATVDASGHVATCPVRTDTSAPPFAFNLGAQDDTLSNQAADVAVTISGQAGDDTLTGGAAAEFIDGGFGDDEIHGGDGDDFIFDGPDEDLVDGGAGQDNLQAGDGADDLLGGPGADTAYYGARLDRVEVILDDQPNDGEEGELDYVAGDIESVTGGDGDDRLVGNEADNYLLTGHKGNDVIAGAGGADRLTGGEGNDALDGGTGPDVFSGREGDDQITARDGERDSIACGVGTDNVVADYNDSVAPDCELVDRSLPPPPPPPPIDTTAPALQLSGATAQKVLRQRGVLVVAASPTEATTVTAKGKVIVLRSAKVFKLTRVTQRVPKGAKRTLKLKLTKKALNAIGRALKAGKKVNAKVTVTAKDVAGNLTTKRRTIRLRR
jgi:hemolysin type calcium-binding protein